MSPAFNELVLDLNGNKYINCGNVSDRANAGREKADEKSIANDRVSLSTPTEARDLAIASDSCECVRRVRVRACARERAGSAFCFGGFGLPAAGLWSSRFYGLHDGIYLKRPAAVIWLLWTFVTPTRDRVRKTTRRRDRVGFRKSFRPFRHAVKSSKFHAVASFEIPFPISDELNEFRFFFYFKKFKQFL